MIKMYKFSRRLAIPQSFYIASALQVIRNDNGTVLVQVPCKTDPCQEPNARQLAAGRLAFRREGLICSGSGEQTFGALTCCAHDRMRDEIVWLPSASLLALKRPF